RSRPAGPDPRATAGPDRRFPRRMPGRPRRGRAVDPVRLTTSDGEFPHYESTANEVLSPRSWLGSRSFPDSVAMDKDLERIFLETLSKALVSLPFDVKVLLEAVADPDLEHSVREIAAATV